jgi:hypothetical protein
LFNFSYKVPIINRTIKIGDFMEETSKMAWQEYNGSEEYIRARSAILRVLSGGKGPLTGREICVEAGQEGLWKRLRDMERENFIEVRDKRKCLITGKTSLTWVLKENG